MRMFTTAILMACTLGIAACSAGDAPASAESAATAPDPAASAETSQAVPGAGAAEAQAPTTGIWFDPASLSECGSGREVVTVNWDVSAAAGVSMVKISPIEDGVAAAVFATGAPQGSKETGPWMKAGGTMAVLDATNDRELARATVGSIPCAQ